MKKRKAYSDVKTQGFVWACKNCPECIVKEKRRGYTYYCRYTDREIQDINKIPDWCPFLVKENRKEKQKGKVLKIEESLYEEVQKQKRELEKRLEKHKEDIIRVVRWFLQAGIITKEELGL